MVQYIKLPDGSVGAFNDNDTPDIIQAKIKKYQSSQNQPAPALPVNSTSNDYESFDQKSKPTTDDKNLLPKEDQLFEANNPLTRMVNTIGGNFWKHLKEIGLEPETDQSISKASEYLFGPQGTNARGLGEATLRTPAELASLVFEGGNAVFQGVVGGVGQGVKELGGSDKTAAEIMEFVNFAALFAGANAPNSAVAQYSNMARRVQAADKINKRMSGANSAASKPTVPTSIKNLGKTEEGTPATLEGAVAEHIVENTNAASLPIAKKSAVQEGIASALQAAKDKLSPPQVKLQDSYLSWWDKTITRLVYSNRAVERYIDAANLRSANPLYDLQAEYQNLNGWQGLVNLAFEKGVPVFDRATSPSGKSYNYIRWQGKPFEEIIKPVSQMEDRFYLYQAAKRDFELSNQVKLGQRNKYKPLFTEEQRAAALDAGENKALFEQVSADYQNFNKGLLQFAEDTGLLTPEERLAISSLNKDYVPFYRYLEKNGTTSTGVSNPFKRIDGSGKNVRDIRNSIVSNVAGILKTSIRNRRERDLLLLLEREGFENAVQRVGEVKPTGSAVDDITKNLIKDGANPEAARTAARAFYRNDQPGQITVRINGKNVSFEIKDPYLWHAFQNLNFKEVNQLIKIARAGSNFIRGGIVNFPTFIVRNFARDSLTAFVQSSTNKMSSFVPGFSTARGLGSRLAKDDSYWSFVANGGSFSTLYKGEIGSNALALKELQRFNVRPENFVTSLQWLWNKITSWGTPFEEANRVAEFRLMLKEGYTPAEAAQAARNVSTDFALRPGNEALQTLFSTIPFSNASWQSLARTGRVTFENPARTFIRGFGTVTVPQTLLYLQNKDNPEYWRKPDYLRDNFFIVFPDSQNPDSALLIPKPFEYGLVFGTLWENLLKSLEDKRGKIFTEAFARFMVKTFSFAGRYPAIVQPMFDLARNKDYAGVPIETETQKRVSPEYRFTEKTSPLMIELGQTLGVSPIQLEFLFRSIFSDFADMTFTASSVINKMNKGQAVRYWEYPVLENFFKPGKGRPTQQMIDFYDALNNIETAYFDYKLLHEQGLWGDVPKDEQERITLYAKKQKAWSKTARKISDLNSAMRDVLLSAEYKPKEKEKLVKKMWEEKQKIFETVLKIEDKDLGDTEGWQKLPKP